MLNRVGEKRKMNNGQYATIIAYRRCKDIDVQFEDGTIVTNKTYQNFKLCTIKNPNFDSYSDRVGMTKVMSNGQVAKIIKYNHFEDIEIEFEDGTVVKKKSYDAFLRGSIANPNWQKFYAKYIGQTNVMRDGQTAKIVGYRTIRDLDVEYEDGRVLTMTLESFRNGIVNTIKEIQSMKEGTRKKMKNGQWATIKVYRSFRDIDVEFEDGTVIEHIGCNQFNSLTIKNPNLPNTKWKDRTNETRRMNCGLMATIIVYRSFRDIDIQFEDGEIVEHKDYASFKDGLILHPKIGRTYKHQGEHVNEEKRMRNGHIAKIVRYRCTDDMDVLFDNGVLRKQVKLKSFRTGSIAIRNFKYKNFIIKDIVPNTDYYVVAQGKQNLLLTYDEMDKLVV